MSTETQLENQSQRPPRHGSQIHALEPDLYYGEADTIDASKENDPHLVEFEEGDPKNPRNFPMWRKIMITALVSQISFCLTTSSSISSAGAVSSAREFGCNEYLGDMATGLYFIGFGVGVTPIGPLSEIYGRNAVYFSTFLISNLFCMGCALAPNMQTLLVCRFFGGVFGAAPLSNSGGSLADISDSLLRSWLFPTFSCLSYVGPALAPLIGGYINESHLGWRWIYWVTFIYSMGILALCVVLLPETCHHIILGKKAKKLRKKTNDLNYRVPSAPEITPAVIARAVFMPLVLLVREPIILFCNVYITIAYIIFFGDLESYSVTFEPYNLTDGQIGLLFIPIAVGFILSWFTTPFIVKNYSRVVAKAKGSPPPEIRILPLLLISPLLPISLFWLAWTSGYTNISLWCPGVSGLMFGFGFIILFISIYQYLIDVYEANAATALASITLARYWASGVWVVFVRQIYRDMGSHWATSMLAFVSAAMIPVTWVFFRYGKTIRMHSKYVENAGPKEMDILEVLRL